MTKTFIDYQKLTELCSINGLKDNRYHLNSTEDAHQNFMREYGSIFGKKSKVRKVPAFMKRSDEQVRTVGYDYHALSSGTTHNATGEKSYSEREKSRQQRRPADKIYKDEFTHDIGDYMSLVHAQKFGEKRHTAKRERIKTLRTILKKLPFERSSEETDNLFLILKSLPIVSDQMPDHVLKEMCMTVQMDTWKEADITVFGNLAFYMVIKGSVRPASREYLRHVNETDKQIPTSPTPDDEEEMREHILGVGECFGTLVRIPDVAMNSRVLSVVTAEPNCELLKITTSDYARITEQIESRDRTEKINLLQSTGNYKFWTRQPIQKVAKLFSWVNFPSNTVIVTEGSKAPFIAFIQKGECHVLRQVNAIHKLKNGKKEKRTKQVVMGKLGASESFGEDSILGDEPLSFSIVSATDLVMAIIDPETLDELDDTTKQLLHQSCSNTFANLKEEEIHDEFIEQELKREWNDFKQGVVMEVLNERAVRPGQGKWAK